MKKKIFIAAALFISINSNAQDSTSTLNEVIVTANKFPNKTSLTGKVVTVITRAELEKSGSKDIAQVLTEQAGVFVNGANSNPGKDKSIYLRGAKVDHTLIVIDGIPVYDPSGIGSNFDIRWLSIDNIERIEILKGSQSTLYGSDAIAGVINIITRKSDKKTMATSGNIQYGSYNTLHANAGISGTKNKFSYNLNYSFLNTSGINEAVDTITTIHETDKDAYTKNNFYASFGYKPNNNIFIQPYFRYGSFTQNYDQGAFVDELDLKANSKNTQTGIRTEFKIKKGKLYLNYNYNKIQRTYIDDSIKSRNGYDIYSKGIYHGNEHFADVFAVFPLGNVVKLTGGVDYRSSNGSESYHSIGYFGPYDSELGKDSLKQNQTGVYAAAVANFKSGFNAELGGRLNHHSAYGNNFVFNFNPSYLFKNKLKFFANVSSGYKTPTLYQLYSEYGNKSLKPETALSIESGIQYFSKNNKFNGRVTLYDRKVENVIIFFYNPVTFESFYINQDKQNDQGVELESSIKLGKSTVLKMNYDYVDGKVKTKNNDKDTSYFNLIRRPRTTMSLHISHHFNKRLYVNAGVLFVGKNADITYDANFSAVEVSLKSYALLNVYGEYALAKNKIKAFVDARNILNETFTEVYGFNAMKRNIAIGLRFNY
jgi:vitamin B12 transporter